MQTPFPKTLVLVCLFFTFLSCSSSESSIIEDEIEQSQLTFQNISSTTFELETLELINNYRASKNLQPLIKLNIIKNPALEHTNYMIDKNKISHDNFNSRASFLINNSDAIAVAENVASGFTNAENVVQAWINSDGHRENIEGDFTHFEITARSSSNNQNVFYFTNIFIKK